MSGAAGVANWTQRSSSQSWTTAGAGTPGSSGSQLATGTGASGELIGIDLPTATVQGWIDTPAGNYGLAITTSGSSECRVDSRESATPAARPEMVITYYP